MNFIKATAVTIMLAPIFSLFISTMLKKITSTMKSSISTLTWHRYGNLSSAQTFEKYGNHSSYLLEYGVK